MIDNPNSSKQSVPDTGFTPPPQKGPRHNLWLWIIGAVVVVLIVGTIAVLAFVRPITNSSTQDGAKTTATASTTSTTPTITSIALTPTPNSSDSSTGNSSGGAVITISQATTTVNLYYGDINAKNYASAYYRWGTHYRNSISYQTFAQGFANTRSDDVQLGAATQASNGTVKVPVTVTATVSSASSITVNTYQGNYIVDLENGQPRLLSASVQFISSNKDGAKRAVSLLEQYYDDINAKDYSDAYSIWGSAYHKSVSSYQFAKGFDDTQSVSININSEGVVVLNNGTVRVPLTITAVSTSNAGTTTHTYQGYYIVGMENEVWHLLSANIH